MEISVSACCPVCGNTIEDISTSIAENECVSEVECERCKCRFLMKVTIDWTRLEKRPTKVTEQSHKPTNL